ncbi:MAG TPA: ankyrin repeat domain-containing protein, partial [Rickettsiales bacterium]|nr:ankyrin repeat domain-containing protein [Rickettsiales bacterium]
QQSGLLHCCLATGYPEFLYELLQLVKSCPGYEDNTKILAALKLADYRGFTPMYLISANNSKSDGTLLNGIKTEDCKVELLKVLNKYGFSLETRDENGKTINDYLIENRKDTSRPTQIAGGIVDEAPPYSPPVASAAAVENTPKDIDYFYNGLLSGKTGLDKEWLEVTSDVGNSKDMIANSLLLATYVKHNLFFTAIKKDNYAFLIALLQSWQELEKIKIEEEKGAVFISSCFILDSLNPIKYALFNSKKEAFRIMLEKEPIAINGEESWIINYIAKQGDPILLEEVIKVATNKNCLVRPDLGKTPFINAIYPNADIEAVKILLAEAGKCGFTIEDIICGIPTCDNLLVEKVFSDVIVQGHNDIIQLLLQQNGIMNVIHKFAPKLLVEIARKGWVDAAAKLMEYGIPPNIADENEKTAIHYAIDSGDINMFDIVPPNRREMLYYFRYAIEKNGEIADHIAEKYPRIIDVIINDKSALIDIAKFGRSKIILSLLANGANFDDIDYENIAANDEIKQIFSAFKNPEIKLSNGKTALHEIAAVGRVDIMKSFLEKGYNINALDTKRESVLHCAVRSKNPEMVKLVLDCGVDPFAINKKDLMDLKDPVLMKIIIDFQKLVRENRKKDAPIEERFEYHAVEAQASTADMDQTPMAADALLLPKGKKKSRRKAAAIPIIQEVTQEVTQEGGDDKKAKIEEEDARKAQESAAAERLQRKQEIALKIAEKARAARQAAEDFHKAYITTQERLQRTFGDDKPTEEAANTVENPDKPVDITIADDSSRIGNIELAKQKISLGDVDGFKKIIENGRININDDNVDLLHYAIIAGKIDFIDILIKNGANIILIDDIFDITDKKEVKEAIINSLLQLDSVKQADIMIHFIKKKNVEILKYLLDKGLSADLIDGGGKPLLHYAAGIQNKEILEIFLSRVSDVNCRDIGGHSSLHGLVICDTTLLQFFIEQTKSRNLDINARSDEGLTPLHSAILGGCLDNVVCLLKEKPVLNIKNKGELIKIDSLINKIDNEKNKNDIRQYFNEFFRINLKRAIEEHNILLAKAVLVQNFLDINQPLEPYINTHPLQLAFKSNNIEMIRLLQSYGAEVMFKDKDGREFRIGRAPIGIIPTSHSHVAAGDQHTRSS